MTEHEWHDADFEWAEPVEPPRRVSVDEQRADFGRPRGQNFVTPAPLARRDHWAGPPAPLNDAAPLAPVEGAWRPLETVKEVGTPRDRAWATVIRAAPLVGLMLPVSLTVVWLFEMSAWWLLPLWGLMSVAAYLLLVLLDLTYNAPSAVERHRTTKRHDLDRYIARREYDLREKVVDAWLNWLDHDREGR